MPFSVNFFDNQFRRQLREGERGLNPFERLALQFAQGETLDYGCGLGNFATAAAQRGCKVLALDASTAAIAHLRELARSKALSVDAREADLTCYRPTGSFETVVSIGLLMFFDCATARAQLDYLQSCVRPAGVLVVNVLTEGTTYLDMFDPSSHCLFGRNELLEHLAGWEVLSNEHQDFPAPGGSVKSFATLIARKPGAG